MAAAKISSGGGMKGSVSETIGETKDSGCNPLSKGKGLGPYWASVHSTVTAISNSFCDTEVLGGVPNTFP